MKLAGPIRTRAAKQWIDRALREYPGVVFYAGSVYGAAKTDFLNSVDVLLFPTRYKGESWGIVINEAFATGAPVITFNRGCTQTVVGEAAGLVVPRDGDYVVEASRQVAAWIDHVDQYRDASQAAVECAKYLYAESQRQLARFADHMFSPLTTELIA